MNRRICMELQLQNLCKQYGTKCAVDNVSIHLEPGVYGLLGANGAGKTTLMRMIEYSCAATPQIRQTGNRLSGLAETAYASLLAQCFV